MKTERIYELTSTFEAHAQLTGKGIEFWLARDLQHLLGYTEWRNFATVISKAKTACEVSAHPIRTILLTSPKWLRSAPVVSGM